MQNIEIAEIFIARYFQLETAFCQEFIWQI